MTLLSKIWPLRTTTHAQEPELYTLRSSLRLSHREAVAVPGPEPVSVSYNELAHITGQLQTMFYSPSCPLYPLLSKGEALGISLPNGLELVGVFLATTHAARVAAPLNPAYKKNEFDFYLDDLKAKAVVVPRGTHKLTDSAVVQSARDHNSLLVEVWWDGDRRRVEYAVYSHDSTKPLYESQTHPIFINTLNTFPGEATTEDVAMILHTSGTTGRPKTVPLSHANISRSMRNIANTYSLTFDDRTYIVMPLFHVHGLIGALLSTLHTGGCAIIPPRFSASNFWSDFIKHGATWYSAVPTIHLILLNTKLPAKIPPIRFIRSCSSALAPATFHKLEETFNTPVLEAYAMTEASHQMTSNNPPSKGERYPGTVGQGQGVDIAILDDQGKHLSTGEIGEVCIRGANVTKGYANNPKANAESFTNDGFFRTGDQGFLDEKRFLHLTGRLKELINRGGEKIAPLELDAALLAHQAVKEAVVFGVPDEKYGQVVQAAVVLKDGQHSSEKELKHFMSEKVAKFKVPDIIYIVEALPKTATGKIQRRNMANIFASKSKL